DDALDHALTVFVWSKVLEEFDRRSVRPYGGGKPGSSLGAAGSRRRFLQYHRICRERSRRKNHGHSGTLFGMSAIVQLQPDEVDCHRRYEKNQAVASNES